MGEYSARITTIRLGDAAGTLRIGKISIDTHLAFDCYKLSFSGSQLSSCE